MNEPGFQLWIGCKKRDGTDELVCPGGSNGVPTFTFWADVSAATGTHDPCARMTGENGKWNDCRCDREFYAACEMRVSPRSYCLQADADGRFTPQCLLHHDIKNLTVTGIPGCGQACWAEPQCHSFNIWKQPGKETICQLNSAVSTLSEEDFKPVPSCTFFKI